jgi:hypothetical protein
MDAEEGGRRALMRQQQQQQQHVQRQRPPAADAAAARRQEERTTMAATARTHQEGGGGGEEDHNEDAEEEPLLVKPMTCSYRALLNLLGTLDFGSRSNKTLGLNKEPAAAAAAAAGYVGEQATTTTLSQGHSPPAKRQKQEAAATAAQGINTPNLPSNNKSSASSSSPSPPPSLLLLLPHELCVRVLQFLTIQRVRHSDVVVTGCSSQHAGDHAVMPLSSCLDGDNDDTWWLSAPGSMPRGTGAEWIQFALAPTTLSSSSSVSSPSSSSAASTSSGGGGGGGIKSRLCRLSSVSMKILPLPQGPLSVSEFIVQRFCSKTKTWYNVVDDETQEDAAIPIVDFHQMHAMFTPPSFSVENRTGWQSFQFAQDLDVDEIRIVCLRNQISPSVQGILSNSATTADNDIIPFVRQLSRFENVGFIAVRFE